MKNIYPLRKIAPKAKAFLFFLLLAGISYSQPTQSIGGVYNPTHKILWLKAEDITPEDGDLVGLWPDASGKNNHALATGDNRPEFLRSSSIFNKQPAVRFNNGVNQHMLQIPDNENLDGMQELTVIAVLRNSSPPLTVASKVSSQKPAQLSIHGVSPLEPATRVVVRSTSESIHSAPW